MIETPFTSGRLYREHELGEMAVQKANWRYAAFGALALSGLLALLLFYAVMLLGRKPPGTPIEVRSDSGDVRLVQETVKTFVPPETTYTKQLRDDVVVLRKVTLDKEDMRRAHTITRARMTLQGKKQYSEYLRTRKPFDQKDPVVVDIIGTPLHDGGLTWDVRWQETTYTHQMIPEIWRGKFTFVKAVPQDKDEEAATPLGLFLDSWSWSKE